MRLPDDVLTETWLDFKVEHNTDSRARLILHYQQLVTAVAKRVGVSLPSHIDDEDLVSYGQFGLVDAMEKFDLEKGVKFETYASTRIRGSIIDELRSIDWIPRSVRSQVRQIKEATERLRDLLQRDPTTVEIAEAIGADVADLQKLQSQQAFIHVVALDALVDPDGESEFSMMNQLEDIRTESPSSAFDSEEVKQALASAVTMLPEREAIVLTLYYYEGLTLSAIGDVLNVTESRVCQMHTRAMSAVRSRLAA